MTMNEIALIDYVQGQPRLFCKWSNQKDGKF